MVLLIGKSGYGIYVECDAMVTMGYTHGRLPGAVKDFNARYTRAMSAVVDGVSYYEDMCLMRIGEPRVRLSQRTRLITNEHCYCDFEALGAFL